MYNTEEFIRRARLVHGDKYDYSKVEYVNSQTKVCIICPIHGEFWQTPAEHLRGSGCIKCGQALCGEKQKYNKDKMTTEAHLSTLCELLWGKKMQFDNGLGSMFALGILSSMFGGGWGSPSTGTDYLKKTLDDENENKEQVFAIPAK